MFQRCGTLPDGCKWIYLLNSLCRWDFSYVCNLTPLYHNGNTYLSGLHFCVNCSRHAHALYVSFFLWASDDEEIKRQSRHWRLVLVSGVRTHEQGDANPVAPVKLTSCSVMVPPGKHTLKIKQNTKLNHTEHDTNMFYTCPNPAH